MTQKLKSWLLDDMVFYTLLIISVAVVAFILGRQSIIASVQSPAGVQVIQGQAAIIASKEVIEEGMAPEARVGVVASRSGTKYHLPSCPGAKQINEENKITFATIEAAKAAGYSAAANCNGL